MAMTKQKFAVKLLFWLLPWPISKALPRSLRIYYFGPSGAPPGGWYDFWGTPKWFWEDIPSWEDFLDNLPDEAPPWWPPNAPSWEDFLDNLPDEQPTWWPIDPYNPPAPESFPAIPDGPTNPSDPYTPGPGPGVPVNQPDNFTPYFNNTCWEPKANGADRAVWDAVNEHWDSALIGGIQEVELLPIGTWFVGRRFSVIRFTFTVHDTVDFYLVDSAERLQDRELGAKSYVYYVLDFYRGNDIGDIRFHAPVAVAFSVTNIEFL